MVLWPLAAVALVSTGAGDVSLLEFSAEWCVPCKQVAPIVRQVAAEGYPIRQVDVDRDRELAQRFRVESVPCFVLLVDGLEQAREVGPLSAAEIKQLFVQAGYRPGEAQPPTVRNQSPDPRLNATLPASASSAPFAAHGAKATFAGAASPELPATALRTGTLTERLLAASVRLRIKDPEGHSVGSGTIIDCRGDEALVLTCGHVFRDSDGKGEITVDLFSASRHERLPGRLIAYDLKSDVGLISFRPGTGVEPIRVAPSGYAPKPGDRTINVGCSHGDEPTARAASVTSIDRFLGPPNLQASGEPVQGRSGGGLFSDTGLLIGVCNAADPADNEGLYAALGSIYALLDRANLTAIYEPDGRAPPASSEGSGVQLASLDAPIMPRQMPNLSAVAAAAQGREGNAPSSPRGESAAGLSREEQAALDEIRAKAQGAEVVCIIRSLADPRSKSEIIVLDSASNAFLDKLAAERVIQDARHPTSLEVPARIFLDAAVTSNAGHDLNWRPHRPR